MVRYFHLVHNYTLVDFNRSRPIEHTVKKFMANLGFLKHFENNLAQ
jgi:hypothetical protein